MERSGLFDRVLDLGSKGSASQLAESLCFVLEQDTVSRCSVLVKRRKTRPNMTEKLLTDLILYVPVNNFSFMSGRVLLG